MSLLPTKVWCDTESDGFHGRLLSIGLTTEKGLEFYGALPAMHLASDWARANVLPHLGPPTHMDDIHLAQDLANWLMRFDGIEVIADWHRDLMHFFALLGPRPGEQLRTPPIVATLKTWLNGQAEVLPGDGPVHHGLADARRLKRLDLTSLQNRP